MTTSSPPVEKRSGLRVRRFLPLIGLALLAWILSKLDGAATMAAFARVSWPTIALAATSFLINLVLKAARWWRLVNAQELPLPWPVALAAFMAAQFYGQVTLGRVGEFYRAEPLIERGVPTGQALASCVADRIFDLFTVLALGAVLGAVVAHRPDAAAVAAVLILIGGALLLLAAAMYRNPSLLPGVRALSLRSLALGERSAFAKKLLTVFRDMLLGTLSLMRGRTIVEAMAWTAIAWVGYYGAAIILAQGLGLGVPTISLLAAASLAALSGLLPVTVSGLGARELIYQQVLATHGVAPEEAVVLALLHLAVMSGSAIGIAGFGVWARARQRRLAGPI